MNLPNRITLSRILMIPIIVFLLMQEGETSRLAAVILFALAALTDLLDGLLARMRKEVTDFGRFIDPIADKLLVLLPLIVLLWQRADVAPVAVLLMVAREIIVSGFRMVAAGRGAVIAAGWPGKIKTIAQIAMVMLLALRIPYAGYAVWLAAGLSIYSGAEILIRNIAILEEAA